MALYSQIKSKSGEDLKKALFVLIVIFLLQINYSYAQCSDAGICSLGGHPIEEKTKTFDMSIGYSYGYSGKDDDISYNSIKFGGTYYFLDNASLYMAIPFNLHSGPLYNVNGIGDLIFNLSYGFEFENSLLSISAGMRLATASSSREFVLQPYKTGLGTNDILLGIDFSFSNLSVGVGYQIAGKPVDEDLFVVERGDDLLLRAGYTFVKDYFRITPQLLFINRFGKSQMYFINSNPGTNSIPMYLEVDGSDQSQFNLLVKADYNVTEYYSHFVEFALPFLERDVNVDGLKRTFTISTGLSFSF